MCKFQTIILGTDYNRLKEAIIVLHRKLKPEMLDDLKLSATLTGKPFLYSYELMTLTMKIGVSNDIVCHKSIHTMPIKIRLVLAAKTDLKTERLKDSWWFSAAF